MFNNKGFTLIELLVIVLIIGILAAIAVPKYQVSVLKANLHKGIPIVASLYQAQQAYYLANGEFATDVDDLDITIPHDSSCTKQQSSIYSRYTCDFGTVGIADSQRNVQYKDPNNTILYAYYLKDYTSNENIEYKKDSRWCFAEGSSKTALAVCENLGGERQGKFYPKNWNKYKLP